MSYEYPVWRTRLQEHFDKGVAGVLAQGGPARGVLGCRYRMDDGRKCLVGHLIPENLYADELEGMTADNVDILRLIGVAPHEKTETGKYVASIYHQLQRVHDGTNPESLTWIADFRRAAEGFAHCWGLRTDVLKDPQKS